MAEKVLSDSDKSDSKTNIIDMGNVGHTMSDESDSDSASLKAEPPKKKIKRVRKVVVEQRTKCYSSSDESDKENSSQKKLQNSPPSVQVTTEASNANDDISTLYQNQMDDPRVQDLVWRQENTGTKYSRTLLMTFMY